MSGFDAQLPDRRIGKRLKQVRESLGLSTAEISAKTKIREEYIKAIEEDNFDKFDSHVYAKGFIKNYALALSIDPQPLVAVYRRDYENLEQKREVKKIEKAKELLTAQKNQEEKKFFQKLNLYITKRRLAYFSAVLIVFLVAAGIVSLISSVFQPPVLNITSPIEMQRGDVKSIELNERNIKIIGNTSPNTLIKINEEPISLKPGFNFETDFLPVTSESNLFVIEAINQLGISSKIELEIIRTDLANTEDVVKDIVVRVNEKPTYVLVRADGIIKFNDIAVPNEAI